MSVVMPKTQAFDPAHTPCPVSESPEAPQIPATGFQPSAAVARICPFKVPAPVDRSRVDPPKVVNRYGLAACGTRIVSRAQEKLERDRVKYVQGWPTAERVMSG